LLLSGCILWVACKKDIGTMRADFVAVRSGFSHAFDSFDLVAYSVPIDSIPANRLTRNVIGNFNDPDLGTSNAVLIHQISLPINQFTWSGRTKLDSVVLRLRLSSTDNYFGNHNQVRQLKAYLLDEDLTWDSIYFSNRKPKIKNPNQPIGSFTGIINISDTQRITLGTKVLELPPHVSIRMTDNFANLLHGAEQRGEFLNITAFKQAFKGIVIVDETPDVAPGSGAFFFVNPRSRNSALYAYYDTLWAEFPINDLQEVVYNNFTHSSVLYANLQKPFQGTHRDTAILMPLSGSKLRIELSDFMQQFEGKNVVINGASITFTALGSKHNSPYKLPNKLNLFASDSLGLNGFLRDNLLESESYFGGFLNAADNSYTFNIARHLQLILNVKNTQNRNINYGLNLLIPSDFPVSASRVFLDTRKNVGKIKLKINYTVVN
jgi:hypothetical protein